MSQFDEELLAALEQRHAQQRYRERSILASPQGASVLVNGESFLAFCSNDYLGLSSHPDIAATLQQVAASHGVGSGASHLVHGHSEHHHRLEQELAEFTGRERVLLFSTGYMANLGVISALVGRGDTVFEDRLNHASLIDAGLLSRAQLKRYRHNDLSQLEEMLSRVDTGRKLVVVDGVFSMDGDLAPLDQIAQLCQRYQAQLMVDDAHGFGVLGAHGGGCAEHFGLSTEELPILVGTLGKSFGTFGAFVAGSHALIETLIQFARTYIYTTALPPAVAAATSTSLGLIIEGKTLRQDLQDRIEQFKRGARALQLPLMESATPIQPLLLGDDHDVVAAEKQLREKGILVGAIRPPTVPEGTGRLRITLNAKHQKQDIDILLNALSDVIASLRSS